jgi:hypothetical protein
MTSALLLFEGGDEYVPTQATGCNLLFLHVLTSKATGWQHDSSSNLMLLLLLLLLLQVTCLLLRSTLTG